MISYSRPAQALPLDGVDLVLDFTGAKVARAPSKLVVCPHCGRKRYASNSPHAPRYGVGGQLVDCVGRPLSFDGFQHVRGK